MIDAGQRAMEHKRRRNLVVLALLSVVAAGMSAYRLTERSNAASLKIETTPEQAGTGERTESAQRTIPVTWPLDVQRDPFDLGAEPVRSSAAVKPKPSQDDWRQEVGRLIRLQGIVSDEQPRAMINGVLYRTGQTVAGYRIKRIEARRVVLEREGIAIEIGL